MQFNTFISSIDDLKRCVNAPSLSEVLLEPAVLARQGKLSKANVYDLARQARENQLCPVLVWDILMPERVMTTICQQIKDWELNLFSAIRVCDPGAAYWLKTYFPEMLIQLIVETGNHNLEALQGWCDIFSNSLQRLVLSIELPEEKLIEYCQSLPVPCELLGLGPILLFYSPRSLLVNPLLESLTAQGIEAMNSLSQFNPDSPLYLEATAAFADHPHRHFPTLETSHGTFMFLDKDQFILDRLDGLREAGLHTVRLDLRHLNQKHHIAVDIDQICRQALANPAKLRKDWIRETRAPFFKANRTTALFPRMKSKVAEYRNDTCLAEVLSGESGKYVVFYTWRCFDSSEIDKMVLPTGEAITPKNVIFRNVNGERVDRFEPEQILVTDWIKKAVPGSLLLGRIS